MSRPIWKVIRGKKQIGNWHTTLPGGVRVNLRTKDANDALRRAKEARSTGRTDFRDDVGGAAAETIAALDINSDNHLPKKEEAPVDRGDPVPSTAGATADQPPPSDAPDAARSAAAAPSNWAEVANATAGAASDACSSPSAAAPDDTSVTRLSDLPFLEGAFVSVSKMLVYAQLGVHSKIAKARGFKLGAVGEIGPPPTTIDEYMAREAQPWPATDPREYGRQLWEKFLRRICPETLPLPDWALAPIVVAAGCLPVQLAGMTRIDPTEQPPPANNNGAPTDGAPAASA